MPTIRLTPSTKYLSNSSYLSVSNESNMYTDTDSTIYATVSNTRNSTTSYYLYLRGFNFNDVPSNAIIDSFTVKVKASESGGSTSTSYVPKLCNNTTTITGSCNAITTSVQTLSFTGVTASFDTIKGYGSNFGIRINCRRNSRNTAASFNIYGAEIEVTYHYLVERTITTSCNAGGSITPSGSTIVYDGDSFTLTISPESENTSISVTDNGVDVTGSISEAPNSGSDSAVIESYATSGSINGTYYQQAVGKGYDGSSVTGNNYASSGSTATITYSFGSIDIPSNATNISVTCKVKGHLESTSNSSEKAECQLYAG